MALGLEIFPENTKAGKRLNHGQYPLSLYIISLIFVCPVVILLGLYVWGALVGMCNLEEGW